MALRRCDRTFRLRYLFMREASGGTLKTYFLGWQCRIRQVSVRDFGGQPLPAMRPRISGKDGTVISPAVNVLLGAGEPSASTAFFKFQLQKTNQPEEVRRGRAEISRRGLFSDPGTVFRRNDGGFAAGSAHAARMARVKNVWLDFEQYSQSFHILCAVRIPGARDPVRSRRCGRRACSIPMCQRMQRCSASSPTGRTQAPNPCRNIATRQASVTDRAGRCAGANHHACCPRWPRMRSADGVMR